MIVYMDIFSKFVNIQELMKFIWGSAKNQIFNLIYYHWLNTTGFFALFKYPPFYAIVLKVNIFKETCLIQICFTTAICGRFFL